MGCFFLTRGAPVLGKGGKRWGGEEGGEGEENKGTIKGMMGGGAKRIGDKKCGER